MSLKLFILLVKNNNNNKGERERLLQSEDSNDPLTVLYFFRWLIFPMQTSLQGLRLLLHPLLPSFFE